MSPAAHAHHVRQPGDQPPDAPSAPQRFVFQVRRSSDSQAPGASFRSATPRHPGGHRAARRARASGRGRSAAGASWRLRLGPLRVSSPARRTELAENPARCLTNACSCRRRGLAETLCCSPGSCGGGWARGAPTGTCAAADAYHVRQPGDPPPMLRQHHNVLFSKCGEAPILSRPGRASGPLRPATPSSYARRAAHESWGKGARRISFSASGRFRLGPSRVSCPARRGDPR